MKKLYICLKKNVALIGISIIILVYLCHILLNTLQLEFRQWIYILAIISSLILIITGLFQFVLKIKMKTVKIPLLIVSTILSSVICLYVLVFGACAYNPEHVVIRDDKELVGYVSAFKQIHVNYYDYKNFIVRGSQIRLYEDYGRGSHDPIESSSDGVTIEEPEYYVWYDTN